MPQHSSEYDPSIHADLRKADWDVVLLKVMKYAIARANTFSWLGDSVDPEALVHEAIARAYGVGTGGTYRNWDIGKCPDLADFLIGIIRSITSHMAEHEKYFPKKSLYTENGSPKDKKILKSIDEAMGTFKPKTPEEELIENENLQALTDRLDYLSKEDDDLGMVILCIEDGISKPHQIAEITGFEIKKVNNLKRKLRRKLKKHDPKIKAQSSTERWVEWA